MDAALARFTPGQRVYRTNVIVDCAGYAGVVIGHTTGRVRLAVVMPPGGGRVRRHGETWISVNPEHLRSAEADAPDRWVPREDARRILLDVAALMWARWAREATEEAFGASLTWLPPGRPGKLSPNSKAVTWDATVPASDGRRWTAWAMPRGTGWYAAVNLYSAAGFPVFPEPVHDAPVDDVEAVKRQAAGMLWRAMREGRE